MTTITFDTLAYVKTLRDAGLGFGVVFGNRTPIRVRFNAIPSRTFPNAHRLIPPRDEILLFGDLEVDGGFQGGPGWRR